MMKISFLYSTFLLFLIACNGNINQQNLVGKWKYISYNYQNKSINKPLINIVLQNPSIVFNKDRTALIYSSGKVLSRGSYQLDGKIIRYEEVLSNGEKRKIPFLIKELNSKQLIFQTMNAEVMIITANKEILK